MFYPSLVIGKLLVIAMRTVGHGGGALPGLVVERLNRRFLPQALQQLRLGVVIITGTNGKTTTTKVLTELLRAHDVRVLTNETGSNFVRGAIATVLKRINWRGSLRYDIAVFELDEAYARRFVRVVQPSGVVALNIQRDQMDRFGEIDTTAQFVGATAAAASDWVVLNANDPRIAALAQQVTAPRTFWFGHVAALTPSFLSDDQHHHLDDVSFYEAAAPTYCLASLAAHEIDVLHNNQHETYAIQLEGTHNAINVTAALTALHAILPQADVAATQAALAGVQPAFGRGEKVILPSGTELRLQLVKNPSGFTHALRILSYDAADWIGIAINDDYADGRDVSWLWDVDFAVLAPQAVACAGTRGADMAVRLKYDAVPVSAVYEQLSELVAAANTATNKKAIIFCTYTAMLRLRKVLAAMGVTMEKVEL